MNFRITLENLIFHSFHGLYPEEKVNGNQFTVSLHIDFSPSGAISNDEITHTIDYAAVYSLIREEMQKPKGLLEALAKGICEKILLNFLKAESITLSVSKHNPPIGGPCEKATVTVSLSRHV
ncbi:MAG: dihydroneopterin aldolase [Cyclobacteriaceae bacterium]